MAIQLQVVDGGSLFEGKDEGHCILLLEEADGLKTFKEYSTVHEFLESIINMYEEYRERVGITAGLRSFNDWMDSFTRIEVFTYDMRLGRYHLVKRDQLKNEFEDSSHEPQIRNPGSTMRQEKKTKMQNGFTNLTRADLDKELDQVAMSHKRAMSSSEDEDWDQ